MPRTPLKDEEIDKVLPLAVELLSALAARDEGGPPDEVLQDLAIETVLAMREDLRAGRCAIERVDVDESFGSLREAGAALGEALIPLGPPTTAETLRENERKVLRSVLGEDVIPLENAP